MVNPANLRAMKFVSAVVVYLILGVVLSAGILMLVKGSAWLFAAGVIGYLVLFSKFGCLPPH